MNALPVLMKLQGYLMGVVLGLVLLQGDPLQPTLGFMIRITPVPTRLLDVVLKNAGQLTGIEIVSSEKYVQSVVVLH